MSDRQIKLYTTETVGGTKTSTTTINNVNPEATGAVMKEFAQRLNSFTTNVYAKSDMVETYNLDTEEIPVPTTPKTTAIITAPSTATTSGTFQVSWTGDYTGNVFVTSDDDTASFTFEIQGNPTTVYTTSFSAGKKIFLMIPETENYTSAQATINAAT